MTPRDFIITALELANSGKGKPRQSNLRRAASTAYYALFHTLAKCCADLLVGGQGADRSNPAWIQAYRALEHGSAKTACKRREIVNKFPKEIEDFANMFVTMQEKRHRADYDPNAKHLKSAVLNDIEAVTAVIDDFQNVPIKDRRAFSAFVLFKLRS